MEKTKKTFGEVWCSLTNEQTEYLKGFINKQRQDAVKHYKSEQLRIGGVMHPLKTFDIHNCINDIAKAAQHRSCSVYELSKDQVFRYACKVAIDKMLYNK